MARVIKLCVFGSRGFDNYKLLEDKLNYLLVNVKPDDSIVIISGTASGADSLGERYALNNGLAVERYPAKWTDFNAKPCNIKEKNGYKYNSLAGMNRNRTMADVCDIAVAFFDGKSPGTKQMIEILKNKNKQVKIIYY